MTRPAALPPSGVPTSRPGVLIRTPGSAERFARDFEAALGVARPVDQRPPERRAVAQDTGAPVTGVLGSAPVDADEAAALAALRDRAAGGAAAAAAADATAVPAASVLPGATALPDATATALPGVPLTPAGAGGILPPAAAGVDDAAGEGPMAVAAGCPAGAAADVMPGTAGNGHGAAPTPGTHPHAAEGVGAIVRPDELPHLSGGPGGGDPPLATAPSTAPAPLAPVRVDSPAAVAQTAAAVADSPAADSPVAGGDSPAARGENLAQVAESRAAVADNQAGGADGSVPPATGPATGPAPTARADGPAPLPASPVSTATQVLAPVAALHRRGADGVHQLTVSLSPDELGPISIVVELRDGTVSMSLTGGSETSRDALRAALPDLRRLLEDAGLTTSSLEVRADDAGARDHDPGRDGGHGHQSARPAVPVPVVLPAEHVSVPVPATDRALDVQV